MTASARRCLGRWPSPGTPAWRTTSSGAWLHEHFTEPQLIELGHFIALTLGQQRFLKTVGVRHGEVLADTDAGLDPEEAARLHAAQRLAATPGGLAG